MMWFFQAKGIPFKFIGEILERNTNNVGDAGQAAFDGWMNSPHHKEIIDNPRFNHIGVGYVEKSGSNPWNTFAAVFTEV